MKQHFVFSALLIAALSVPAHSKTPPVSTSVDWNKAEQNYVAAIHSENDGVRESAAGFIGTYKLQGATLELIEVLRYDKVEHNRMVAARALVQIGEKIGIDAVKESVIYDGSRKVVKYCEELLQPAPILDIRTVKN